LISIGSDVVFSVDGEASHGNVHDVRRAPGHLKQIKKAFADESSQTEEANEMYKAPKNIAVFTLFLDSDLSSCLLATLESGFLDMSLV
jgi:hypothetical protein